MMDKRALFQSLQPDVYCFADSLDLCKELLEAGARIIQLRAKALSDEKFTVLAHLMQKQIHQYEDALLIVNDRVNVALAIDADGVHVGQQDEAMRYVIHRVPEEMVIGMSVETVEQAVEAEQLGATYIGAGAVYPTPTKSDVNVIGVDTLQRITEAVSVPVVAIGGISLDNVGEVFHAGARHAAIISEINNAPNITKRIHQFREKIGRSDLHGHSTLINSQEN